MSDHTPYGLPLYGVDSRWYRPKLWARALDAGASITDLASAYNVCADTIRKKSMPYRRQHVKAEGQGNCG